MFFIVAIITGLILFGFNAEYDGQIEKDWKYAGEQLDKDLDALTGKAKDIYDEAGNLIRRDK